MLRIAKTAAKPVVFGLLASAPFVSRKLRAIQDAGALTILNLHRVAPPDRSTYPPLPPHLFESLLRFARRHFEIVTFADLGTLPAGDRPRLILSFDDGYADFAEFAAPLLEKYDVRANQNIIPECVETGMPPLNVVMQDFVGFAPEDELRQLDVPGLELRPTPATRHVYGARLSQFIKSQAQAAQQRLAQHLLPQVRRVRGFTPTPMMSREQVRLLSARHEFGAHSYSHASLGTESDDYLRDDLARCSSWFEANLGQPVRVYAFPNGSHRPEQVEIVRQAGIENILLVEEDFSAADAPVHKRFTFYADSPAEVRFRATGGFRRPEPAN